MASSSSAHCVLALAGVDHRRDLQYVLPENINVNVLENSCDRMLYQEKKKK